MHRFARVGVDDEHDLVALVDRRPLDSPLRDTLDDVDRDHLRLRRGRRRGRLRRSRGGRRGRRRSRGSLGGRHRAGRAVVATAPGEGDRARRDGGEYQCVSHGSPRFRSPAGCGAALAQDARSSGGGPRPVGRGRHIGRTTRGGESVSGSEAPPGRASRRRRGPGSVPMTQRTSRTQATATGSWSASPRRNVGEVSRKGSWPVWTRRSMCSWQANPSGASGATHHAEKRLRLRSCNASPTSASEARTKRTWRSVREVLVHRAGLRAREAIGEGVCDEDSGRSDRRHQDPGKQAPTHVPRMMPAEAARGGGSRDRERRGIRDLVPGVTFNRCAACACATWPCGRRRRPMAALSEKVGLTEDEEQSTYRQR